MAGLQRPRGALRTAAAAVCLAGAACSGPDHATVIGDAYIAPDIERVIELPHLSIHLVEEIEEFDSVLSRRCPYPERRLARAREADSSAILAAWAVRDSFLTAVTTRATRTDSAATFALDSVPPGRYRLWADTVIGSRRWTWLQRLWIRRGDTVRVNLSNANADENPFVCF